MEAGEGSCVKRTPYLKRDKGQAMLPELHSNPVKDVCIVSSIFPAPVFPAIYFSILFTQEAQVMPITLNFA